MSGSRNFQWDHFLVSRFGTKLNRSAPSLFRVFRVLSGLNSEWTRLLETPGTTASGGGRARLAQRAGNVASNELDFREKNDVEN